MKSSKAAGSVLFKVVSRFAVVSSLTIIGCTQTQAPTGKAPEKGPTDSQSPASNEELELGQERKNPANADTRSPATDTNASANGQVTSPSGTVVVPPAASTTPAPSGSGEAVIIGTNPTQTPGVINAGRGDRKSRELYKAAPAGYSPTQVQAWVAAHQAKAGQGFKYVFISPAVAANRDSANTLRVAVAKAWNHLSWQSEIDLPEDISDGAGLTFALNVQKVWGADAAANWGFVAACSPKANIRVSPAPRGDCAAFNANQPVQAERFVFNAVHGGPYANVHKTPNQYSSFTRRYPLGPIFATSTQKDAIVCGPRITAFRVAFPNAQQGQIPKYSTMQEALNLIKEGKGILYSYSSDEFDGRDNGNIRYVNAPTGRDQRGTGALRAAPNNDNTAIASEWWMQLPNGFMYFSIHGEGSQERGKGESPFAIDPANWKQGAALATGRSCITCHIKGNQSALSDPEFAGKNGWTSNDDLTALNLYSASRFAAAMEKIIYALSDDEGPLNDKLMSGTIEPVKHAIMLIEGPYRPRSSGSCNSFCNGKFAARRSNSREPGKNMCETLPAR